MAREDAGPNIVQEARPRCIADDKDRLGKIDTQGQRRTNVSTDLVIGATDGHSTSNPNSARNRFSRLVGSLRLSVRPKIKRISSKELEHALQTTNAMPRWRMEDVNEFIATDSVYGPKLKFLRSVHKFGNFAAKCGGLLALVYGMKHARSLPGAVLIGAVFGVISFIIAEEIPRMFESTAGPPLADTHQRFLSWWAAAQARRRNAPGESHKQVLEELSDGLDGEEF